MNGKDWVEIASVAILVVFVALKLETVFAPFRPPAAMAPLISRNPATFSRSVPPPAPPAFVPLAPPPLGRALTFSSFSLMTAGGAISRATAARSPTSWASRLLPTLTGWPHKASGLPRATWPILSAPRHAPLC